MSTLSAIIAGVGSVRRLIHLVAIQHVGWVAAAGLVGFIGNELVAIYRIHADAELDVDPTISLIEAHRIAHEAEHTPTHAVPKLSSALIHAYPATTEAH